jgi:hypothetical protein
MVIKMVLCVRPCLVSALVSVSMMIEKPPLGGFFYRWKKLAIFCDSPQLFVTIYDNNIKLTVFNIYITILLVYF